MCFMVSAGGGCHWQVTPPYHSTSAATNWDSQADDPDIAMLWAVCCFSFLRAYEFTVPCELGFDPSSHLSWGNLAVDIPGQPSVMSVRLEASKTDPFRKGITLFIGKVSSDLCLVSAMLAYLLVRGRRDGLFRFRDGKPLTRQRFVSAVRDALVKAGIRVQLYIRWPQLPDWGCHNDCSGGWKTLSSGFWDVGRAWLTWST